MDVKFKKLRDDAVIPSFAHEGDAGFDLVAVEDVIIEPGETALVKTGLAVELPEGYEMQIRPRSGIPLKTKLRVSNSPGTVDSNYRGEIGVIVDNINRDYDVKDDFYLDINDSLVSALDYFGAWSKFERGTYLIRKGDRIAQGVIVELPRIHIVEATELSDTERGAGGFGHTGVRVEKYVQLNEEGE